MPVLLHSTLQLKCIERGDPEPNVTWTNNGTQLSNNNTFVITNVTFKDAGQYGCVAMNRAGNISGNIWIDVVVYPVVDVYPRNQTVPEGKTTNISCKAKGVPLPKLSWKFDEGELPPTAVIMNTSDGSLLQLPNTTKRMEGRYKCKATNKAGEEHSTSTLHVLEKPTVVISGESCQTRMEGDKLNLTCLARVPTSKIRWTIKTVSRGKMANITKNGDRSILIIERVKVSDSGEYMCEANNAAGFASSSVNVEVRVYPVVDVYPRNQTVPEGKTTNISCKAKGVPLPKLSWKFDQGELPPTTVVMNTSDGSLLQLPNTTKSMKGRYKCKATNKAGEEHSTSTLHVLEKPTVVISGESYQRKLEGDRLTLTCKTKDPTSQIRWKMNTDFRGKNANITKNGDRSILIIESVKVSDSGKYICEAKNAAGTAASSVEVEVRALQVHIQAEWYYIVGPVSAVAVTAFIAWHLCKRRTRESSEQINDMSAESTGFEESHEMKLMDVEVDEWEISRDRIRLEEVIGSGAFGTVWRATLSRKNGKPGIRFVAAKCFKPTSGEQGRKALMREIGLGKALADSPLPNVVEFIGCVTTQIHPILIMEYLHCGDLLGFLRKSRGIADKYYHGQGEVAKLRTYHLVSFSKQIATAMGFLASRGIIHRDLAARNVLLDKNYVCKVTDFGLSYQNFKYGHGNAKKGCVPVKWTAPEILFGDAANLSTKSDVWSYGVVLYEIFTIGGIPYPGWSEAKTIAELQKGYRMPKPPHISNTMYHFMEKCWQENPGFRPNFENIRKDLLSLIEKELYLGLLDESKYDGTKYSMVEDVCAASVQPRPKKKWSSLKL
ncbi:fibroblast growth factor receptor 1-A-like [Montipora capricornis]|uniref:fibroblast growth factor receptor 1-A-like n=1 Tax=Montipora capricornis TaxID=246305 RepID=UPI0035F1C1C8